MSSYLLAGGGTAGHVNPMLAIADELRRREPEARILCVGTAEGLEAQLVPARGFAIEFIPKMPFPRPRTLLTAGPRFVRQWNPTVSRLRALMAEHAVDVVIGVGGYASAPAYAAARASHIPLVIHEANAKPGFANRWGASFTPFVGVTFPGTPLPHATVVGTPLRREIEELDRDAQHAAAREFFGLPAERPVLLVTGGSLGARSINTTMAQAGADVLNAGYSILHTLGRHSQVTAEQLVPGYVALEYCDRMDLALAAATAVVARAGSATVSELSALGLPAVYIPYPVGNGEQRFNAASAVEVGGALLVKDAGFTPEWVRSTLVPLLRDEQRLAQMAAAASRIGVRDGTQRMVNLIDRALSEGRTQVRGL
jgi:UDP-N-acetylglucosamine--N-acetylmuramyl-(pentapeptide) pyrophosphoryl-undecaprenol N-acetylglucosamine transferase